MVCWDTCKRPWKVLKIRGLTLPCVSSSLLPPKPVTPGQAPPPDSPQAFPESLGAPAGQRCW